MAGTKEFIGKVVWLEEGKSSGSRGVILEQGETGGVFPFIFSKLEGYKDGQVPAELAKFSPKGLRTGLIVKFRLETGSKNSEVISISPLYFRL